MKLISIMEAGVKVANELGCEISEDEAKKFITRIQNRKNSGETLLSDDELESVAGGDLNLINDGVLS